MISRIAQHPWIQRLLTTYDALWERITGGRSRASSDPSAALYRRIRLRLTLWYASVLAVVLLLAGGLLYYSMWQTVMGPINSGLTQVGQLYTNYWQENGTPPPPCTPTRDRFFEQYVAYVVCYTGDVTEYYGASGPASQAKGFLQPALALRALKDGSANDVVDGGNNLGPISRYALVVRDPDTNQVLGVLQVGEQVGGQTDAMNALLRLLLILGPLSLVGATVGGYFLAQRALDPARLAFTRQQAFIADASHELRTPLSLLRANADVLLRGRARLDPDDTALLEDIVGETNHLTGIANNLLTLARLDSGGIHLERDIVDLATIAADTAHRVDALARERGITVRTGDLTSAQVLGDPQLLAQATLALVDNAIKYAGDGSTITLSTSREQDSASLTVQDDGPGIAAEHLPLLGRRFYRPDKARSRAAGGAGLGLSVVRSIMALHSGSLELESAPGTGTRAILRLRAITLASHPGADSAADTATTQETEQHV